VSECTTWVSRMELSITIFIIIIIIIIIDVVVTCLVMRTPVR
jgi:hypothetical protein